MLKSASISRQGNQANMAEENKRPQFGSRHLTEPSDVFEHNAWDDVEWDDEQEAEAKKKVQQNSQNLVDEEQSTQYDKEADKYWDTFYTQHQNRFFKDRKWLFSEFPELLCGMAEKYKPLNPQECTEQNTDVESDCKLLNTLPVDTVGESSIVYSTSDSSVQDVDLTQQCKNVLKINESLDSKQTKCAQNESNINSVIENTSEEVSNSNDKEEYPGMRAKHRIFEVGCGVGNTVFPVLQTINDPELFVYCCDLSATAIELVKQHKDYTDKRCHAFVSDVTDLNVTFPFPDNSLDVITLIFVMSAIHPERMQATINRLAAALKPGGIILFRDYGRYDMAQLRFKTGRCLSENFYVRGDGTRVYFFTQEELKDLFIKAGLVEKDNYIDRRLQVNRGRMIKMYRVWIQCKYTKPVS